MFNFFFLRVHWRSITDSHAMKLLDMESLVKTLELRLLKAEK